MTKTLRIEKFMPTISSEQKRKISELTEWHQEYIDSIVEHSEYSFSYYLNDIKLTQLGDFCDELDEVGIGFSCAKKTEVIGCKEVASGEPGKRPEYVFFTIEV